MMNTWEKGTKNKQCGSLSEGGCQGLNFCARSRNSNENSNAYFRVILSTYGEHLGNLNRISCAMRIHNLRRTETEK